MPEAVKFLLKLIACGLLAYAISLALTVWANPEIRFWRDVQLRRQAEIGSARERQPHSPVILFTGGSSTAFSVDPAVVESACGMPAFNLALPAAAGPRYLLHQALEEAREGDVLVVGLEADFLAEESSYPAGMLSFGMALRGGKPSACVGSGTFPGTLKLRDALNFSRPGARYLLTLAYRGVSGEGYRYKPDDYRYHGRIETAVAHSSMVPQGVPPRRELSESGRQLLTRFREAAAAKKVRLFYAMPVLYTSAEHAEAARSANAVLLDSIDPLVPVIDDGTRGVATERDHFSDSHQHLTAEGSLARSQALAGKLAELLKAE